MSTRPPRRVRWHPTPDTLAIALHKAAKPAANDVDEVLTVVRQAARALREGVATEHQWSVLSGSLAVSLTIERQGVVRGLREHLDRAEAALQTIYNRAQRTGAWRPPVLHFHEIEAVNTFVDLHAFQARELSRAEFLRAIDTTTSQVRSSGGAVTVVRELAA